MRWVWRNSQVIVTCIVPSAFHLRIRDLRRTKIAPEIIHSIVNHPDSSPNLISPLKVRTCRIVSRNRHPDLIGHYTLLSTSNRIPRVSGISRKLSEINWLSVLYATRIKEIEIT